MSDVLSQGEIDSLLQQLSSGEIDAEEIKDSADKQVKNYDFARPSKFSKEHLRTLEIIFEHYGRLFVSCDVQLTSVGSTMYLSYTLYVIPFPALSLSSNVSPNCIPASFPNIFPLL